MSRRSTPEPQAGRNAAPAISIVVPAFNADRYLSAALGSIRAQAFDDYEVIVVDDGSEGSQEGIVRSVLPHARLFRQTNLGPAAARNVAIRASRGRLIAFLDADDLWTATALTKLLKGLSDAPSAGLVQGSIKRFVEIQRATGPGQEQPGLGHAYFSFNVGALLLRREVLDRTGLFNESLRQSEDVDLHIRIKECGVRKLVIPDTVLYYRRHSGALNERQRPPIIVRGHQSNWLRLLKDSLERRRQRPADLADEKPDPSASITVVMVVRNGRDYLPTALASIRGQTLKPAEILAVVGPSDDGTIEYLEAQPDVRVAKQEGEGLASARNQAVDLASHDLIAFLDCDDIWHPEKLKAQVEALSLVDGTAYSITSFVRLPAGADFSAETNRPDQENIRIGVTPSALLSRRSAFETLGGFDASLGSGCDTDWFFRARKRDIPCAVASQILMFKRIHANNLSRSPQKNRGDMFQIIRKNRT